MATLEVSFSAEVLAKVKEAVKAKLKELDKYIDDELPDYVIVLVANRRSREQMNKDLKLFLGTTTDSFVGWLQKTMNKINKAASGPSPSETPPAGSKPPEKSSEKRKRRHSKKSPSPKRSISSPSLSPPPQPKRVKGRVKTTSTSSDRRKARAGRLESESESTEKRRKPKLASVVTKPRQDRSSGDESEPDNKLPSLVKVKERPKAPRKGAASGRLLLKAVRDAQTSPEPSSSPLTETSQKRSLKDRLGKIGDVPDKRLKVQEKEVASQAGKDDVANDDSDDGGLQLLLEESEEEDPAKVEEEKKKPDETKFIVTLEGVKLNRGRPVKERLGAEKKAERRGSVKDRLGMKDVSKQTPSVEKKASSPSKPTSAVGSPKKPSLAVEPVVQGAKVEIVDKKALRGERFKTSPVSKPVVVNKAPAVVSPAKPPPARPIQAPTSASVPASSALDAFGKTKCKYWPSCKLGAACLFYHPPVPTGQVYKPIFYRPPVPVAVQVPVVAAMCTNFPHCPFGDGCKFGHPPCKFGDACLNRACGFSHVRVASAKPCYYGSGCRNPACTFLHPGF